MNMDLCQSDILRKHSVHDLFKLNNTIRKYYNDSTSVYPCFGLKNIIPLFLFVHTYTPTKGTI